ncbi:MAG TPA: DUF4190 domain-containing protein [Candidatus Dormibacteraeota bacterium]
MSQDSASQLAIPVRSREARATAAFVLGICCIVLMYPLGVVLGPLALWFGISALRRIQMVNSNLGGLGFAVAGIVMGAIVSGLYALILFFEVVVFLLTGGLIPAY